MNVALAALLCGCFPCAHMNSLVEIQSLDLIPQTQNWVANKTNDAEPHRKAMALPTYDWMTLIALMKELEDLLYPNGLPAIGADVPINPMQVQAESQASSLISSHDTQGTPMGLTVAQEIDANSLTDSILAVLDDQPGIVSFSIDWNLRRILGNLIGDLAN